MPVEYEGFIRDPASGALADSRGVSLICAPDDLLRIFRFSLEKELTGAWQSVLKSAGRTCGGRVAADLESELVRAGETPLAAQSFDARFGPIERYFEYHGWGRLRLDMTDASEHGLVVARLEHSCFVEAFSDVHAFVDPLFSGVLQGYFEHIGGQLLGCEEIACIRYGASTCTFVITAQTRLDQIAPFLGRESATTILARLKT